MYAETQHLYILPNVYRKLQDCPEEEISRMAERYFNAPQSSPPHHLPICELLSNFAAFAQQHLQEFAACALFSVLVDVHAQNTNYASQNLREIALQQILAFTLEIPNFHISCLTYEQALKCAEFVDEFYCEVADFYRFLFAPQPILHVNTRAARQLSLVHTVRELGAAEQAATNVNDAKNRAASRSRPGSKQTNKPQEDCGAQVIENAYEITLMPLDQGVAYEPPPPPTEEELRVQELKQVVEEAQSTKSEPEAAQQEIDVDKMAKAIQLAAQEELEKVRTRIIAEIETGKKPGKK